MRLAAYLALTGESVRAFARRAGISHPTALRIIAGFDARGSTWRKIRVASRGKVTMESHFPSCTRAA